MALHLDRPLLCFDLETTGLDINTDRVVEISCVKLLPDHTREVRTRRVNPTVPISKEASAVHGIYDDDVRDAPRFEQLARSLLQFFAGCDLTGFNLERFDLPLLSREFQRCGVVFPEADVRVIDSRRIFMLKEPRTLEAAYRFYCGKDLSGAHSAEADAVAAADVLLAQLERYDDLPTHVPALHDYCHPVEPNWVDPEGKIVWQNNEAVLNFGKRRGRPLRELVRDDADYLRWMLSADFSRDVVAIIERALRGELPKGPLNPVSTNGVNE